MQIVQWSCIAPLGIFALLPKLHRNTEHGSTDRDGCIYAAGRVYDTGAWCRGVTQYLVRPDKKISPRMFWRASRPALITAFATSSSAATLPVTLRCTTEGLNVRPEVVGLSCRWALP